MASSLPTLRVKTKPRLWAKVVLVVLLLVGLDSIWDYVEAGRVRAAIGALQAAKAPTSLSQIYPQPKGDAADAAAFYSAAAALAGERFAGVRALGVEVDAALGSGAVSEDLVDRLSTVIADRQELFGLVDRAAALTFTAFTPETTYGQRSVYLYRLYYLCSLRTIFHTLKGHGAETTSALLTELALISPQGPLGDSLTPARFSTADRVAFALNRGVVTDLQALQERLAAVDDDARLSRQLMIRRALSIDLFLSQAAYRSAAPWNWLARPLAAHVFVQNLNVYDQLLAGSQRAWPTRMETPSVSSSALARWVGARTGQPGGLSAAIPRMASDSAALRAAAVGVAIERYRQAHEGEVPTTLEQLVPSVMASVPTDPFSGRPLQLKSTPGEMVVYSVGPDRSDSGADVRPGGLSGVSGPGAIPRRGADIGVRITLPTGAAGRAGGASAGRN